MNMRYFLVDYENVNWAGLYGISFLTEEDNVIIFFSDHADTVNFTTLDYIMRSKAVIKRHKVTKCGNNALDFQLSTYVGYLAGTNTDMEIYIISKDQGFLSVLDFCKERLQGTNIKVEMHNNINSPLIKEKHQVKSAEAKPAEIKADVLPRIELVKPELEFDLSENQKAAEASEEIAVNSEITASAAPEEKTDICETKEDTSAETALDETIDSKTVDNKAQTVTRKVRYNHNIKNAENTNSASSKANINKRLSGVLSQFESLIGAEENEKISLCDKISGFIADSDNKHALYLNMVKTYGQTQGVEFYNGIKKDFAALKNLMSETVQAKV